MNEQSEWINLSVHLEPDPFSLSRVCYVAQETVFWKREVWKTVGEIDESYQFVLDYDLWQRMLAAQYQFHLLPRFNGLFRVHPQSKGTRLWDIRSDEVKRVYWQYLGTRKDEMELHQEINPAWWNRTLRLQGLGRAGLLNHVGMARKITRLLTLPPTQVPNPKIFSPARRHG
jgi:hypothetical protein